MSPLAGGGGAHAAPPPPAFYDEMARDKVAPESDQVQQGPAISALARDAYLSVVVTIGFTLGRLRGYVLLEPKEALVSI